MREPFIGGAFQREGRKQVLAHERVLKLCRCAQHVDERAAMLDDDGTLVHILFTAQVEDPTQPTLIASTLAAGASSGSACAAAAAAVSEAVSRIPVSIHRRNSSTRSEGQAPSHGMTPVLNFSKIAVTLADTSSYDHKSNAKSIDSRSLSLNNGLMSSP